MNSKTIYIHIGTEKTGTKSIQNFCCSRRDFLKRNNLFYPCNLDRKYIFNITHWPLAAALSQNNKFVPEEKRLSAKELFDELKSDIEQSGEERVLISAEPFSVNVTKAESISELKKLLNGYEVKIILYLRRQDDYYISHTSTKIKGGVHIQGNRYSADEAINNPIRYNYLELVKKWAKVFGKENMIIKTFEDSSLKNQNILSDFFGIFNMDISQFEAQTQRQNTSLSLDALYFMNMVNKGLKLSPKERSKIYSLLEKRESRFKIKNLISPTERKKILKHYQANNETLAKEYLNRQDGSLFKNDIGDANDAWEVFHGLNAAMTFEICRFLMRHKYGNQMPAKFSELLMQSVVREILDK